MPGRGLHPVTVPPLVVPSATPETADPVGGFGAGTEGGSGSCIPSPGSEVLSGDGGSTGVSPGVEVLSPPGTFGFLVSPTPQVSVTSVVAEALLRFTDSTVSEEIEEALIFTSDFPSTEIFPGIIPIH